MSAKPSKSKRDVSPTSSGNTNGNDLPSTTSSEGFIVSNEQSKVKTKTTTKKREKPPKPESEVSPTSFASTKDKGKGRPNSASSKTASPVSSNSRPRSQGASSSASSKEKKGKGKDDDDISAFVTVKPKSKKGDDDKTSTSSKSKQKKEESPSPSKASPTSSSPSSGTKIKPGSDTKAEMKAGNNNIPKSESKEKSGPKVEESKPLFSYGNNGNDEAPQATFFDLSSLCPAALTMTTNQCTNTCHWWKSRSMDCSKCQVQELQKRPKPTTGGYGPKRVKTEEDEKNANKGLSLNQKRPVSKDVQEFSRKRNKNEDDDENDKEESSGNGRNRKRGERGPNECAPPKQPPYLSETQAAFGPPHLQKKSGRKRLIEKKEDTMRKMREFMKVRPPWDPYFYNVPETPYTESLGATEAKVKELESIGPEAESSNRNSEEVEDLKIEENSKSSTSS